MNELPQESELLLAPEWADWLIENYIEGAPLGELAPTLTEAGVPEVLAQKAVSELRQIGVIRSLRQKIALRDQLLELARLKGQLARLAPSAAQVERRANVSAHEFFENYYAANRPVILTDIQDNWPARHLWSRPEYFAEKFGNTELAVCMGREGDPYCDRNFQKYLRTMTMAEYAAWLAQAGETNDGYLISNNRLLENPAFDDILKDIISPEAYVDPQRFRTYMSFWLGPKGTVTPLHHDGNNILFCQVVGRKEFYLVSPWETDLLTSAQGYYAHAQVPRGMETEGLRPPDNEFPWPAQRIVLNPGETLFLPVAWWHQVRALDLSVSISFLNFRADNNFHWYAPGKMNEV